MKKIIATTNAPAAIGPYSQANQVNGMLFISGQLPIDPATGKFVEGGVALVEDKSCYAGSVQALDRMISNLVKDCNIPFVDAVRMATLTPAEVIGIEQEYGSLHIGKRADLCLMDEDYTVIKTVISGNVCYGG